MAKYCVVRFLLNELGWEGFNIAVALVDDSQGYCGFRMLENFSGVSSFLRESDRTRFTVAYNLVRKGLTDLSHEADLLVLSQRLSGCIDVIPPLMTEPLDIVRELEELCEQLLFFDRAAYRVERERHLLKEPVRRAFKRAARSEADVYVKRRSEIGRVDREQNRKILHPRARLRDDDPTTPAFDLGAEGIRIELANLSDGDPSRFPDRTGPAVSKVLASKELIMGEHMTFAAIVHVPDAQDREREIDIYLRQFEDSFDYVYARSNGAYMIRRGDLEFPVFLGDFVPTLIAGDPRQMAISH